MLFRQEATMIIAGIILCLSHTFLISDAAFTWLRHDASVDFIQGQTAKLVWTVDVGSGYKWAKVSINRNKVKSSSGEDIIIDLKKSDGVKNKHLSGREADINLFAQGTSNVVNVTFTLHNLVKTTDEMYYRISLVNSNIDTDMKYTFLRVFDAPEIKSTFVKRAYCIEDIANIIVSVDGNPKPTITCKHGQEEVDPKGFKIENDDQYGNYTCKVTNIVGSVTYVVQLIKTNADTPPTPSVVPDPPIILKIQSTASTIEITWRRPTHDCGSLIIDYQISINTKPLRAISVKDTSVIIAGLSKATKYQVNVLARNVVGYSSATITYISTKNDDMANEQMSGSVVLGVCLPIIFILLLVIVLILVYNWWKRRKEKQNEARPRSSSNNNEEAIYMNDIAVEDQVPSNVAQYESVGNQEQHQPATQLYQSLQTQTPSDTYSSLSPDTKLPPRPAVTTNSGVYQDLQGASNQYQSLDNSSRV